MMDTIDRIKKILSDRGWSEYRLAKECGLSQSTISNMFHRNTAPTLHTLNAICKTFDLTLAQFFTDGESVELTPEQRELFARWLTLTADQKELITTLILNFH